MVVVVVVVVVVVLVLVVVNMIRTSDGDEVSNLFAMVALNLPRFILPIDTHRSGLIIRAKTIEKKRIEIMVRINGGLKIKIRKECKRGKKQGTQERQERQERKWTQTIKRAKRG
jgi:hypothetical protein